MRVSRVVRIVVATSVTPTTTRRPASECYQSSAQSLKLPFGFRRVKLPARAESLYLRVLHGFGADPLLLHTPELLRATHRCIWYWVQANPKRWALAATIRYITPAYALEHVRVLTSQGCAPCWRSCSV